MKLEIEAKFRVESHEPVRQALERCGAVPLGSVVETNYILDTGGGALRRKGCGLRLRINHPTGHSQGQSTCVLTFKGPMQPGPLKRREELETVMADPDGMLQLLEALGYVPVLVYGKNRTSFQLADCRVELDDVPHLGRFVEIEGPGEHEIAYVQSQIGLAGAKHVPQSYVRLLSDYCASAGFDPLHIPGNAPR